MVRQKSYSNAFMLLQFFESNLFKVHVVISSKGQPQRTFSLKFDIQNQASFLFLQLASTIRNQSLVIGGPKTSRQLFQ